MTNSAIVTQLERVFHLAEQEQEPFACIGIETQHASVDLLKSVVNKNIRTIDIGDRYGDQSVFVILPDTQLPGAIAVAGRIVRQTQAEWSRSNPSKLKCMVGLAFFPDPETKSWQDLLHFVDAALEHARLQEESTICLLKHQRFLYIPIHSDS